MDASDFLSVAATVAQAREAGLKIPVIARVHSMMVRQSVANDIAWQSAHKYIRINGIICPDATWAQVKELGEACRAHRYVDLILDTMTREADTFFYPVWHSCRTLPPSCPTTW